MKNLSLIEKTFFLKKTKIFADLDLDQLLAISDKLSQDVYDKKEKVFGINQVANRLYFIAKGSVALYDENGEEKQVLKENEFFGDEGIFNEKPRTYQASCLEDSLILTLSRTNFLTIISECPSVAVTLLQCYAAAFPLRLKVNHEN